MCMWKGCRLLWKVYRLRVVSNILVNSGEIHARARKLAPARRRATRRIAKIRDYSQSRRYMKGVPFLSKMIYKRVGFGARGGASPYKTLFGTPPAPLSPGFLIGMPQRGPVESCGFTCVHSEAATVGPASWKPCRKTKAHKKDVNRGLYIHNHGDKMAISTRLYKPCEGLTIFTQIKGITFFLSYL